MQTKIIDILDPQAGKLKETIVEHKAPQKEKNVPERRQRVMESLGLGRYRTLQEVATTSQFPTLLRVGLKQILFDSYDQTPTTFQEWVRAEQSDKPAEDWVKHFSPFTEQFVKQTSLIRGMLRRKSRAKQVERPGVCRDYRGCLPCGG